MLYQNKSIPESIALQRLTDMPEWITTPRSLGAVTIRISHLWQHDRSTCLEARAPSLDGSEELLGAGREELLGEGTGSHCHRVSGEARDKARYSGIKSEIPPSLKLEENGDQQVLFTITSKFRKHLGLGNNKRNLKTMIQMEDGRMDRQADM